MEEEREGIRTELHMALKVRIKKGRLLVDSKHLLLPKEGTSLQQVRTGQEKHAQLQVSVFTTSCSLPGQKGRVANKPLLRTEKD